MSRQSDITVRLSTKGAEDVKRALEAMGAEGRRALRQIEQASKAARPEAKALATAMDDINGRVGGLGRDIPGVTAALGAFGPMGAAAATGLGLVAGAAATLIAQTGPMMEWAATLTDTAQALDVTTDQLQFWRFALEEAGGAAEDADAGLAALNSTVGALRTGLGDTRQLEALKELGLNPDLLRQTQDTEAALLVLVEAFEKVTSEADRTRLAQRLNLEPMLPILRLTSEQIQQLTDYFVSLGINVEQGVVRALDEAQRKMELNAQVLRANLAPAVVDLSNAIADASGWIAGITGLLADVVRGATWAANKLAEVADRVREINEERYRRYQADPNNVANFYGFGGAGQPAATGRSPPAARPAIAGATAPPVVTPPPSIRRPPPAPPAGARAGSSNAAATAAERAATANRTAQQRAEMDQLRATLALAETDQERFAIRRQIAETEARQADAAIAAARDMTEATKAAQRAAVAAARTAALKEIELEEQRSALAATAQRSGAEAEIRAADLELLDLRRERLMAERALSPDARQADIDQEVAQVDAERFELRRQALVEESRLRQQQIMANAQLDETQKAAAREAESAKLSASLAALSAEERRQTLDRQRDIKQAAADEAAAVRAKARAEAEVIADAEMLAAQTAAEQAETRRDQMDAELRILDLTTRRMLNEIELLEVSEEAKELARKAVRDAAAARKQQIERGARGGVAGYLGELEREARTLGDRLDDVAGDGLKGFEDALVAIGTGAKDAKEAFADMARSILADLIRLAARQWIILPLMQMMGLGDGKASGLQMPSGGGGGGGGGAINFLAQVLPSILRFNGGFGGGRAIGGPVAPGVTYLTGERGPELFMPSTAGTILPNHVLQAARGQDGGGCWGRPQLVVMVHNAPPDMQVRQRADGGVDVYLPRLEAVERGVQQLDRSFEQRALMTVAEANRRGML